MSLKQTEAEILRLADEWVAAELRGDAEYLAALLADDFAAVGPLGFMLTKTEWIGRHRSGNMKYRSLGLSEVSARVYGGATVVIGRQSQDATFQGNDVKAELRTTAVFVSQGGQWKLVGVHMSPIGQPPSFAQQRGGSS
jgi:ketosteroid isomerase-like protein